MEQTKLSELISEQIAETYDRTGQYRMISKPKKEKLSVDTDVKSRPRETFYGRHENGDT